MARDYSRELTALSIDRQWATLYAIGAFLTLIFQIWVRSYQCAGVQECGLSFAKAVIWSLIWPISWVVYLAGYL